jgi:hypothetical protein
VAPKPTPQAAKPVPADDKEMDLGLEPDPVVPTTKPMAQARPASTAKPAPQMAKPASAGDKEMDLGLEPDPVPTTKPMAPLKPKSSVPGGGGGMGKELDLKNPLEPQKPKEPQKPQQSQTAGGVENQIKTMYSQTQKSVEDFKKTISNLQNLLKQARGK